MFNLKRFKIVKELKNVKSKTNWIGFSSLNSTNKQSAFLDAIISENQFVKEDLNIRKMVEETLVKEFSEDVKNLKSYDFLVDSVVNKLKQKQLGDISSLEEIE